MMTGPLMPPRNTNQAPVEPIHWMPGGQARFVVIVALIILIWWGWVVLTREPVDDEDEDA